MGQADVRALRKPRMGECAKRRPFRLERERRSFRPRWWITVIPSSAGFARLAGDGPAGMPGGLRDPVTERGPDAQSVPAALVGIRGIRRGLGLGSQGRGQFGEGPRYDVQVAVHRPQLHQDVPDIGFQARRGGGLGAGRRGDALVLCALLPARCARARGAAPFRARGWRRPLLLIPPDARRGGRGAARQPVKEARGSLWRGGDHRVEAGAPRGARAKRCRGCGKRWGQQRGQHGGAGRKRLGLAGGGGGRQGGGGGAGLLRREEQGGGRLGVQGTGL